MKRRCRGRCRTSLLIIIIVLLFMPAFSYLNTDCFSESLSWQVGNRMLLLFLSLLFCCLVQLHCEEISTPFLFFRGYSLSNNSYVTITEIGNDNSLSVQCRSELEGCCETGTLLTGSWSFPNGSELLSHSGGQSIYQGRTTSVAILRRRDMVTTAVGIYCCRIAYNSGDPSAKETLCVGIYDQVTGSTG